MKRLVLAIALMTTPLAAWAQCAQERQAMSCVEGQVWDAEANSCVPITTS